MSIVGQQGTTIHIDAPTTIGIDDPMAALQQSEVLHFTFLTMMNSDVSNAAASHSRGPTPGSMGDVSELSCPESGLGLQNFHQQNSFSDFGFDMQVFQQRSSLDAMQPSSEQFGDGETAGPKIFAAIGFSARWKARSQTKRDDLSMFEGEWSGSQPQTPLTGSAPCLTPSAKSLKTQDVVAMKSNNESRDVTPTQLQNVARLASLEAMQRFRTHDIKMPWEQGHLAPVFGGPMPAMPPVKGLVPPVVVLVDTLARVALTKQDSPLPMGPVSKFAVKRIAASKCVIPEDEMLSRCLNQIESLLLLDLQGTEVCVTLCNLAGGLGDTIEVPQILKDCFEIKATATILRRTSSLWSFAGWMLKSEQTPVWSVTKQQLYSYMCSLRDQNAAPTRASHVLEALTFFDANFRFRKTSFRAFLAPRVQGAAHSMYLGKRKLRQAPQLTSAAVTALEIICTSNTNLLRTAVSETLLFFVYASVRWSDFSRLEHIWVDKFEELVLVEAESAKHKTSKSKEDTTRLLPFTTLGRFDSEDAWDESFVNALNEIQEINGKPFLPAWNDGADSWAVSPMTTAEVSLFLKEFLDPDLGQEAVAQFSSHSCKPTVLTRCGMTDFLTTEERTMLGHHVEASTKSATTCNRDPQLLPKVKVAKVLQMIVEGELDPDASRASRLNKLLRSELPEEPDDMSQESDLEDTEVASIHSKLHLADRPGMPIGEPDEYTFVAHKLTETEHVLRDEETDRLAFGRLRTINMNGVEPNAIDAATAPFCIQ